jgi:hypothetical protein
MFRAHDQAGNVAVSSIERLDLNEPPSPKVTSPANGSSYPEGEAIALDGTASKDPDGQMLEFQWQLDGLQVGTCQSLEEIVVEPGRHTIVLYVSDGFHRISSDPIGFNVDAAEPAPDIIGSDISFWMLILSFIIVTILIITLILVFGKVK